VFIVPALEILVAFQFPAPALPKLRLELMKMMAAIGAAFDSDCRSG